MRTIAPLLAVGFIMAATGCATTSSSPLHRSTPEHRATAERIAPDRGSPAATGDEEFRAAATLAAAAWREATRRLEAARAAEARKVPFSLLRTRITGVTERRLRRISHLYSHGKLRATNSDHLHTDTRTVQFTRELHHEHDVAMIGVEMWTDPLPDSVLRGRDEYLLTVWTFALDSMGGIVASQKSYARGGAQIPTRRLHTFELAAWFDVGDRDDVHGFLMVAEAEGTVVGYDTWKRPVGER